MCSKSTWCALVFCYRACWTWNVQGQSSHPILDISHWKNMAITLLLWLRQLFTLNEHNNQQCCMHAPKTQKTPSNISYITAMYVPYFFFIYFIAKGITWYGMPIFSLKMVIWLLHSYFPTKGGSSDVVAWLCSAKIQDTHIIVTDQVWIWVNET